MTKTLKYTQKKLKGLNRLKSQYFPFQVHDVSIYCSFKGYLRSSIGNFIREKSPLIRLNDLSTIIEEPWHYANTQRTEKKIFKLQVYGL